MVRSAFAPAGRTIRGGVIPATAASASSAAEDFPTVRSAPRICASVNVGRNRIGASSGSSIATVTLSSTTVGLP